MKKGIHPKYVDCTIVCACGNTVHTRATKERIHVEICSKCHPYYTGKQKLVDSAGMVDRFKKRYANKNSAKNTGTIKNSDNSQAQAEDNSAQIKQDAENDVS